MVAGSDYVPERGDLVWLSFSPQAGHERSGRRPALVLSPSTYNRRVGLALFCPITSQVKGYPFEVLLPSALPIGGAILSDQVRSLDWRSREVEWAAILHPALVAAVQAKVRALVEG